MPSLGPWVLLKFLVSLLPRPSRRFQCFSSIIYLYFVCFWGLWVSSLDSWPFLLPCPLSWPSPSSSFPPPSLQYFLPFNPLSFTNVRYSVSPFFFPLGSFKSLPRYTIPLLWWTKSFSLFPFEAPKLVYCPLQQRCLSFVIIIIYFLPNSWFSTPLSSLCASSTPCFQSPLKLSSSSSSPLYTSQLSLPFPLPWPRHVISPTNLRCFPNFWSFPRLYVPSKLPFMSILLLALRPALYTPLNVSFLLASRSPFYICFCCAC